MIVTENNWECATNAANIMWFWRNQTLVDAELQYIYMSAVGWWLVKSDYAPQLSVEELIW